MGKYAADGASVAITPDGLQTLIEELAALGYRTLGPKARDGAIVYDDIAGIDDLPAGWTERQEAGTYALERRDDGAFFGYAVGPHSWKQFLHPPAETLWTAKRSEDGSFVVASTDAPLEKFAFIGVRSCEIQAIAIQDQVFCGGAHSDTAYAARRGGAFILAVNCGEAGETCFCVSMEAGPKARAGYDLALTELIDDAGHRFLVEIGSEKGAELLGRVAHEPATVREIGAAEAVVDATARQMGRQLDTHGIKELLLKNLEHPRWDEVASRCLTCGNCTMVCPTCFCTTVEDHTDLTGESAERVRQWDSCFTMDFSYLHGGSVRASAKSRYRQWLTHKLANWIDQFGTSGCVGCGRCITWCPTGIDITEEVAAIRSSPAELPAEG